MPKYDDVDENFEYLDLSNQSMPYADWMDVIADLAGDAMIRQIDLSYTIKYEDAEVPSTFEQIIGSLCDSIETNKHLTALDFSGNHLNEFGPYPASPHSWDYVKTLTASLKKSTIRRLDLSDNMILSPSGRVYSSLADLLHVYVIDQCEHFRCIKLHVSKTAKFTKMLPLFIFSSSQIINFPSFQLLKISKFPNSELSKPKFFTSPIFQVPQNKFSERSTFEMVNSRNY